MYEHNYAISRGPLKSYLHHYTMVGFVQARTTADGLRISQTANRPRTVGQVSENPALKLMLGMTYSLDQTECDRFRVLTVPANLKDSQSAKDMVTKGVTTVVSQNYGAFDFHLRKACGQYGSSP